MTPPPLLPYLFLLPHFLFHNFLLVISLFLVSFVISFSPFHIIGHILFNFFDTSFSSFSTLISFTPTQLPFVTSFSSYSLHHHVSFFLISSSSPNSHEFNIPTGVLFYFFIYSPLSFLFFLLFHLVVPLFPFIHLFSSPVVVSLSSPLQKYYRGKWDSTVPQNHQVKATSTSLCIWCSGDGASREEGRTQRLKILAGWEVWKVGPPAANLNLTSCFA